MKMLRQASIIAALLLVGGCAHHSVQKAEVVALKQRHHIHEFDSVTIRTPIKDILKTFGQPDRNVGSGISILVYDLDDGSMMRIGSADEEAILYLDHVFPDGKRNRMLLREEE